VTPAISRPLSGRPHRFLTFGRPGTSSCVDRTPGRGSALVPSVITGTSSSPGHRAAPPGGGRSRSVTLPSCANYSEGSSKDPGAPLRSKGSARYPPRCSTAPVTAPGAIRPGPDHCRQATPARESRPGKPAGVSHHAAGPAPARTAQTRHGWLMTDSLQGYVAGPGASVSADDPGLKASSRSTAGALSVFETSVEAGPPLHVHDHEDECLYVLAGQLSVRCGDATFDAPAGSFVFLPTAGHTGSGPAKGRPGCS
jgi:mannose-6-phosphate isomerase-like protein (cupin superfamily)